MKYNPTAEHYGEVIDCRCLALEAQFAQADEQQIRACIAAFAQWLQAAFEQNLYIRWKLNGRAVPDNKLSKRIAEMKAKNGEMSFEAEGAALGEVVHDGRSFRQYDKELLTGYVAPCKPTKCSVDYPAWFCEHGADLSAGTPEEIRQFVLKLFALEGRKMLQQFLRHDLQADAFFTLLPGSADVYRGSLSFSLSCFCLGSLLDETAEKLAAFAERLSELCPDVNAWVGLNPQRPMDISAHMSYFDGSIIDENAADAGAEYGRWQQAEYEYLHGVSWCNIVSRTARGRSPDAAASERLAAKELAGGALCIRSKGSISEIALDELGEMKRMLYGALFPGMKSIKLEHLLDTRPTEWSPMIKPRALWEEMPLFEEEVTVSGDELIFRHAIGRLM